MQSWKAWLLVLVIFLTGAAAGAFGMRAYMARHLPEMLAQARNSFEERILAHIDAEVGLTPAQKQELLPILRQGVARVRGVHEGVRAEMDALRREMDDAVAARLTPEQRVKFAELRERMDRLHREGPPPPPPGGMGGPPPPPGGMGFPPPPPRP